MWDDALFTWSPAQDSCVLTQQEIAQAESLRQFLNNAHIRLLSFGCDLSRNPVFRDGALTNRSSEITRLARRKLERAFAMAKLLNAESFRLDLSREGWETPYNIDWSNIHRQLSHSLNALAEYAANSQDSSIRSLHIVSGNTAVRRHSFLANPGEIAAFLATLPTIFPWKICPFSAQDISLSLLTFLAQHDLLACYPLGGGPTGSTCATNLLDTVQQLATLQAIGWQGPVEFRSRMLRSEVDPDNRSTSRRQFISNASASLTIAINFVQRLQGNWANELTSTETELMALTQLANLSADEILMQTITPPQENSHLSIDELASRYDQHPLLNHAFGGRQGVVSRPSGTSTATSRPHQSSPFPRFSQGSKPVSQAPQYTTAPESTKLPPQPLTECPKASQPPQQPEENKQAVERERPQALSKDSRSFPSQSAESTVAVKQTARERRQELRRERLAARANARHMAWQERHDLPLPVPETPPFTADSLPPKKHTLPSPVQNPNVAMETTVPASLPDSEASQPSVQQVESPEFAQQTDSHVDNPAPPTTDERATLPLPANKPEAKESDSVVGESSPLAQEISDTPSPCPVDLDSPVDFKAGSLEAKGNDTVEQQPLPSQSEPPQTNLPVSCESPDKPLATPDEENETGTFTPGDCAGNGDDENAGAASTRLNNCPPEENGEQPKQIPIPFPELEPEQSNAPLRDYDSEEEYGEPDISANDQFLPDVPSTETNTLPSPSIESGSPFLPENAQVNASNNQGHLHPKGRHLDNHRELKYGRSGRKGRNGPPKTFRKP